ncbi:MAG TPA: hypothetical protein DCZ69_01410, partial [Syntrophobacteraceae bacterium]|nr:hypothetical protein [Syntrophobacteraceae bacterium]
GCSSHPGRAKNIKGLAFLPADPFCVFSPYFHPPALGTNQNNMRNKTGDCLMKQGQYFGSKKLANHQ